jgi:hypothetical protein
MMKTLGVLLVAAVVALMVYIRAAPSDPERWHAMPDSVANRDLEGGAMRQVEGDLGTLDAIIRDTPRTRVLAGSVEAGMITYITRSRVFGFPDYTTVRQDGDMLEIHGRLRFGKSDMGVNAARIDEWLRRLREAG